MKTKGSSTAISISIISALVTAITGLTVFIYNSDISEAKENIKDIQSVNIEQDKDISSLQTDIKYIKDSQDKMNIKLDKILNKF